MSYRIEYGPSQNRKNKAVGRSALLTVLFFVIFLVGVQFLWPRGREVLNNAITGMDKVFSLDAAESLVYNLQEGEPVKEAFYDFCKEIISDAGIV